MTSQQIVILPKIVNGDVTSTNQSKKNNVISAIDMHFHWRNNELMICVVKMTYYW